MINDNIKGYLLQLASEIGVQLLNSDRICNDSDDVPTNRSTLVIRAVGTMYEVFPYMYVIYYPFKFIYHVV